MLQGSARMVLQTGTHPAVLKDQVTTPGGCTIAGLSKMEEGRVRYALASGVEEAARAASKLGTRLRITQSDGTGQAGVQCPFHLPTPRGVSVCCERRSTYDTFHSQSLRLVRRCGEHHGGAPQASEEEANQFRNGVPRAATVTMSVPGSASSGQALDRRIPEPGPARRPPPSGTRPPAQ
jgi:hypothetical protein